MELRVLQYFLTIAKEESITKAALQLHVSQPTLSRQIHDLEEELGTILFERGSRKITLSEDGILLRNRAEEILRLVHKTESDIILGQTSLNGDIYIGCGETDGMRYIAKAIGKVQQIHPHMTFHLHSGNAEDITDRLEKGLIDFGVLIGVHDLSRYHAIKFPIQDISGVLMRKDSPLAQKETLTAKDLLHQPLIIPSQGLANEKVPEYLLKDQDYHVVATYNLIYNASLMVKEGVGYALGLDKLVPTDCQSDLCFKPLQPPFQADIIFVWKKYQQLSKSAQYFLNTIQQLFEETDRASKDNLVHNEQLFNI